MSSQLVDAYLAQFSGAQREGLDALRKILKTELPDSIECISYGLPCFKVNGKAVAGFGGFQQHNSYFPHSGAVLENVSQIPSWCSMSRGTLRFPLEKKLSTSLVRRLVRARLADIQHRGR